MEGPHAPRARHGRRGAAHARRVSRRDRHQPSLRPRAARGPRPPGAASAHGCRPRPRAEGDRADARTRGGRREPGGGAMSRPLGIVLAGGASSRFGRDKVTAELDGRPLVHHALERLAQVADRVVLVLAPGGPVPPLPPALVDRIDIAHDAAAHQGPLAGLAAALDAALDAPSTALVVGADMPRLHPEVLALLVSTLTECPSAGAVILESDPPATPPMAI